MSSTPFIAPSPTRRRVLVSLLGLLLASGCAHRKALEANRIAVVPVDTLGVAQDEGARLHQVLVSETSRSAAAHPSPPDRVQAAMAAGPGDLTHPCRDSDACLARLGQRVPAELVLSTTLAGLGDLRLVRARLIRVSDGLVVQDLQETVPGGARALAQTGTDLIRRLLPGRPARPWYRQWWVWTIVGGSVAAAVGLSWGLAARNGNPENDPNLIHLGSVP